MRGPPPTPTAVLKLRGSWRAKTRPGEPDVAVGCPRCPQHITGEARKFWHQIGVKLTAMRVVTEADQTILELTCQTYARWRSAERELAKSGVIILSPSKYPIQSPFLAVSNRASRDLARYLLELGLTPASRPRVQAQPDPAKFDPLAEFLMPRTPFQDEPK